MIDLPGKSWLKQAVANHYARGAKCLFVLSTGRVGTTTLAEILQLSNRVEAEHEPFPLFLDDTYNAWLAGPKNSPGFVDKFLTARVRALAKNRFKGFTYAECSNRLTYVAYELREAMPNAMFIHLHRDPAEVVRSAMRRGYYQKISTEDTDWGRNRVRPRIGDAACESWGNWTPFQKCCWYWSAINSFAADFVETTGDSALSVESSRLFHDTISASQQICNWMKLPVPDEREISTLTAEPSNAMQSGNFSKWSDWTAEQKHQLIDIAGATAVRLGYDHYQHDYAPDTPNTTM